MPPRWAVLAIVAFWLATTSWQIQRDVWPYWFPPPDEPPPFAIDMTDEFGTNHTDWKLFVNGDDAGNGFSDVKDLGDGSLEFNTTLRFNKKPLFGICSYIGSSNRITNKGQLLGMSFKAKIRPPNLNDLGGVLGMVMPNPKNDAAGLNPEQVHEIGLDARIDKGHLKSRLTFPGGSMDLEPVQVPENGIVFNPAHLGTRIRQLRNGQSWRVPLLDIGAAATRTQGVVGKELRAAVSEEVILWSGDEVPCFKIEFTQQGKGVIASTWVRQRDGQVLKQQAKMLDIVDLLLIRIRSNL